MPRVTHVKSARKDNPVAKKGEPYYWWKFRFGGKRYSKTYPKQSQLTQSEYFGAIYDLQDRVSEFSFEFIDKPESLDDLVEQAQSFVEELTSELETLRDEQEEKRDNMPESLQYAPTGELLQERYDALDSVISELDQAVTEVENIDLDNFEADRDDDDDDDDDDTEYNWDEIIAEAEEAVRMNIDLDSAMV